MSVPYSRFDPPHLLTEYVGKPGPHMGNALPPAGYDALAEAANTGKPPALVVIGEWRRVDGVTFLDLGVQPGWIEANTSFRRDPQSDHLRWHCPSCDVTSGQKHRAECQYR